MCAPLETTIVCHEVAAWQAVTGVPVLYSKDGNAERIGGLARSLGLPVATEDDDLARELRIDELETVARRLLGDRTVPFVYGYRVRLGVV